MSVLSCWTVNAQQKDTTAIDAPVIFRASVEPPVVTMGERATLHVELVKNGHNGALLTPLTEGEAPKGMVKMLGNIEVRQTTIDSIDLGNNRIQVNYDLVLQPFEPDTYAIPGFQYVMEQDTFTANVASLKVEEPVLPDSLMLNPLRPPMSIKAEWYDQIPDWLADYWYWWLAGLVLLGLIITGLLLYKKTGKIPFVPKKVIPPYVLAKRRLEELRRKRLHELGNDKAFYTELTDILRQYLGGRFKIYALEMTSTQILEELKANEETAPYVSDLDPLLKVSDFVKFAKQKSTPAENIRSFKAVERFIDDTRPVETEAPKESAWKKHKIKKTTTE